MIYNGPIELFQEAERRGMLKMHTIPGKNIPTIDVYDEKRFELFLIEIAGKTDNEIERTFCLSNLESFQTEEFNRKFEEFSEELKNCDTIDDVLNIM